LAIQYGLCREATTAKAIRSLARSSSRLAPVTRQHGGHVRGELAHPIVHSPIAESHEWRALQEHFRQVRDVHLRDLFAADPARGGQLTVEAVGIYLDYSRNRITGETIRLLLALAERAGLRQGIQAMFRGDRINWPNRDRFVLPAGHASTLLYSLLHLTGVQAVNP
jgi:hypothetical protein